MQQVLDVSITFPCAQAYVSNAANKGEWAAKQRETGKIVKYRTSAESVGLKFHPAVFEAYGRAGTLF